ncbi:MAG: cytochrome b N-terminal domain-containing protein [Gemmataceae bacterium]|nr:cytochrome b N-terminal domain-containing protein [Gemmataceae bacterium]
MAVSTAQPTLSSPLQQLRSAVRGFFDEAMPVRVGWPQVLGSVLLFLLVSQALTGFLLALYYSPSTDSAYESVRYIQERAVFGGLIRGMHRWGANLMVIFLAIHLGQVFLWGAYKKPRQWTWVAGCLLLLLVLGFGFTGYLLPWDLKAYFGTEVDTRIAGAAPGLGPYLLELLRGGPELGSLTLPRFYAVHVLLLPALLLVVIVWHLWQVRTYGITPPWVRVGQEHNVPTAGPFFPFQAVRDTAAMFVVFALLLTLAFLESKEAFGPPLEAKADPTNSTYVPRPDWYFLGLQHLLRIFPSGFGQVLATTIIPTVAVLLLLALPFLDRNPERLPRRRPVAMALGILAAAAVLYLTLAGYLAVRREEEALAQRMASGQGPATPAVPQPELPPQHQAELVEAGKQLFDDLQCTRCHPVAGPPQGGVPTLAWEGSRARRPWLKEYLKEPTRLRWETNLEKQGQRPKLRMPNFGLTDAEAEQLAAFVMEQQDTKLIPKRPELSVQPDRGIVEQGQKLVHKTYRCIICHRIGSEGNPFGPDLTHVGSRRTPDFLYAIVDNPGRLDPETAMKNLGLAPDEVSAVVQYLLTLQ